MTYKIIDNVFPKQVADEIANDFLDDARFPWFYNSSKISPDFAVDNLNNYQSSEVSKIEWKTLDECLKSIRPYNLEKKQLIININKVLQEYRLY